MSKDRPPLAVHDQLAAIRLALVKLPRRPGLAPGAAQRIIDRHAKIIVRRRFWDNVVADHAERSAAATQLATLASAIDAVVKLLDADLTRTTISELVRAGLVDADTERGILTRRMARALAEAAARHKPGRGAPVHYKADAIGRQVAAAYRELTGRETTFSNDPIRHRGAWAVARPAATGIRRARHQGGAGANGKETATRGEGRDAVRLGDQRSENS